MQEYLAALNLSKEEKLFSSHIDDCISICDRNNIPKFSGFLDLRMQEIAKRTASAGAPGKFEFFGGYLDAERKIFGVFPDYVYDREGEYPIAFLCFSHSRELLHKDFLGSLMALGIKRELVGDIIVGKDKSYVIVQDRIAEYIVDNVSKIGNVGVSVSVCSRDSLVLTEPSFEESTAIITSMRIDCVVSALCNKSRADAQKLICSERVFVNHESITSVSKNISENDVISVRSFGKFKIGSVISKTKKERLVLSYKKYI